MDSKRKSSMWQIMALSFMCSTQAKADHGHFLAGLDMGWANQEASLQTSFSPTSPVFPLSSYSQPLHDNGFIWDFLVGYESFFGRFVLGTEFNVSWQDVGKPRPYQFTDAQGNHYAAQAEHNRGMVFGLTGRMGMKIAPWISAYLRAGAEGSTEIVRYQAINYPTTANNIGFSQGQTAYRFVGGVGLEFPLTNDSSLRTEYDYSSPGAGAEGSYYSSNGILVNAAIKPVTNLFKIGFVWYFL